MADRNSVSSETYDGKVEEATAAYTIDMKAVKQLSSSGKAAKDNRDSEEKTKLEKVFADYAKQQHKENGGK